MSSVREISQHFTTKPPIWHELRFWRELNELVNDPIYRSPEAVMDNPPPVFLLPAFMGGDLILRWMDRWLVDSGYPVLHPSTWNIDCANSLVEAMLPRLEQFVDEQGRRAVIVGHSRGGVIGRVLAVRRPDLVTGAVAMGSPILDPFMSHTVVGLSAVALATMGTAGVPGLIKFSCLDGECCDSFRADAREPLPDDLRYMSIYSKTDGIIDWRTCLDEQAQHHEVHSSHTGMVVNKDVYRLLDQELRAHAMLN